MSSRTVHKFSLFPTGTVKVSADSRVVLFAEQAPGSGEPLIWIETDLCAPIVLREFAVVGTGHTVPDNGRHVASCVCAGGALVWHLYERIS